MKNQELNYLITPDNNVLIGAPANIDWTSAKGELIGPGLHITKDKELFFLDELEDCKRLVELIKENKEIVLSYLSDEGPQFISVPVTVK